MDLFCRVCLEFFDLLERLPLMYSCGHTICKTCADSCQNPKENDFNDDLRKPLNIFCEFCKLPSDSLSVHPLLKDRLEELQLFCPVHMRKTLKFNKRLEIVFCDFCIKGLESTVSERLLADLVPLNELQETIHGMLQMKFMDLKDLMMKPARMFIVSIMDRDVMSQYRALKFMSLYERTSFECDFQNFHSETNKPGLRFDSNDFHVLCQECYSKLSLLRQNQFIGITGQDLKQEGEKKLLELESRKSFKYLIWNSVLNHRRNQSKTNFAFLAEACVMAAKKKLISIENLACSDCNKLYSTGPRFPLLLNCFHAKCFSCFLINKTCGFCCKIQGISSKPLRYFDMNGKSHRNEKTAKNICISCKSKIKVPETLPFHCICHCIICSHCMRAPVIGCKCSINQKLITRLYPKLDKRVLIRILRNSQSPYSDSSGRFSSKPDQSYYFTISESTEERNLVKAPLIEYLKHLLEDPEIAPLHLEEIMKKVFPKELKSCYNFSRVYLRALLSLYKTIYPVTRDDRRVFDTEKLEERKYFMTVESENYVQIKGFVICGCVAIPQSCPTVKGKIFVSDGRFVLAHKEFSVIGAAGICELDEEVFGNKFYVELKFRQKYLMFSGSNLDEFKTSFRSEGIEFRVYNGNENTGLLYGPISGIIYNKFL